MFMGKVVAVCGMPGSGKGEFAAVLEQQGVPVLSMGDMVRAEVKRQNLAESPGIFGEIAAQLRACLLYTSPSPRDRSLSRMPSSA